MIECPMCRQQLPDSALQCTRCKADLKLLVDYVADLQAGLDKAEKMTRAGELGEAVWAYLAVLEIDPDNGTARRQVGRVATAVRQFDDTAPGRRWARALRKQNRFRRWVSNWQEGEGGGLWGWVLLFLLYFGSVCFAYYMGLQAGRSATSSPEDGAQAPTASVKAPAN